MPTPLYFTCFPSIFIEKVPTPLFFPGIPGFSMKKRNGRNDGAPPPPPSPFRPFLFFIEKPGMPVTNNGFGNFSMKIHGKPEKNNGFAFII